MISATVFAIVALGLCAAAMMALFGITHVAMSGREAIERDGLVPGTRAPVWSLADSSGNIHRSPPDKPLQLIVFTDHSLQRFPSAVEGLRELAAQAADVEIVVVLRHPSDLAEPILRLLGLDGVPVLDGSPSLYGRYNVRVTPFVIFVDSAGRVRGSSLVNHGWQIAKLHQIASLPVVPPDGQATGRFGRGASRVRV
jgi:hypothetical protein